MKIYVGGIIQESNTFCPSLTDIDLFKRGYLLEGSDIKGGLVNTNTEICGIYRQMDQFPQVELVPGIAAWAVTSGKVADDTFEELVSRLVAGVRKAMPLDGILLCLHGAMVSQSIDDCEGYILSRVRETVGAGVPIVCTLDFHAAVTAEMVESADVLVGYRTYPHIDLAHTGERAARCMMDLLDRKTGFKKIFYKLPLILALENCMTDCGPMAHAMELLKELDRDADIVSVSVFIPQPWLDIYDMGAAVVLYVRDSADTSLYEGKAKEITDYIWAVKDQFFIDIPGLGHFIENAGAFEKPVSLVDLGDIVSAGGMGDSTEVLRAFMDGGVKLKTVLSIVDKETVKDAALAGEGKASWFRPGGSNDYGYNKKIDIYATIIKISDEAFENKGASLTGVRPVTGKRALLCINDCIYVIVSEYVTFNHDAEFVRSMGIKPEDMDVIVQKTHQMFKASYKDITKSVVYTDTPGFTDRNLKNLPFRRVKRPVYPLDTM